MCNMTHSHVWRDSFIRETCPIHMCDVTYSYTWHAFVTRVTRLTKMWNVWHIRHDSFSATVDPFSLSFMCVSCLMHTCDVTNSNMHSYVWHDSFICVTWLIHAYNMSPTWMDHVTCTGWRRLIGSPKLQINFFKRATKHRSLLRKRTYKDKGSYESSPPCMNVLRIINV